MLLISLPGLPCFPPAGIGAPVDRRLPRLLAMDRPPRPIIAGYDGAGADIVRARLAPLAEPLAAHVPGRIRSPVFKHRSLREARIADSLEPVSWAMLADAAEWQARLNAVAMLVHGHEAGLRTTRIGTEPGYGGHIVTYPPAECVRPSLRTMAEEIAQRREAAISAIAAYVMLACTTVHPFLDGNGRIARILFNLVLRSKYPGLPYVAIKEITQFSQGDFLIAMNRVHFRQDWEPYFRWLAAILDIHLEIAARAAGATATPAAGMP